MIRLWARALGASSAPEAMLPAPRASRRRAFADTWPFTGKKTDLLEGGLRIPMVIACNE